MTPAVETRSEATFIDRLRNFIEITNPFYLVYGPRDVEWAAAGGHQSEESQRVADRVLRVSTHPDTGETIPRLFRLSAAIPWNIAVSLAMAHPAVMLSVVRSAGVHWVNQTYNCAVNFANRNASSEVDTTALAQTYTAACALSVSIALAATLIMRRCTPTGWKLTAVRGCFPMLAASTASAVNVAMIRRAEWIDDGVNLYDDNNDFQGKSRRAGSEGIGKCAMTRVLTNIPVVTLPVFLVAGLTKCGGFRPSMRLDLICVLLGVSCGVPACLALYPQRERIPVERLESNFHHRLLSDGRTPIDYFYYNKGL
ncbi:sideroflexin [Perkinsela sp. CCAP 1560/4]|nr:sideroflexin [Perkinsela sp. CCAP 1560/4]|eukprot:KNH04267.1 sideroflexin [Perkinsela sp. CCAP 1560/4]